MSRRSSERELTLTVAVEPFVNEALQLECARLGVGEEELVRFAVLYYLADLDSGRIARRITERPGATDTPS